MRRRQGGFTLIELVIVLVIIGILAAIAIPRFRDIRIHAQESSIRGTVGNVRSALSVSKADNVINNVNTANNYWPTAAELKDSESTPIGTTCPLDSVVPDNPFVSASSNTILSSSTTDANNRAITGATGWRYCETSGIFWANTSTNSANTF